ncbi:MAG TPA: ATP-binding protein, partial [Kofleriaceae bacterium]
LVANFVDIARFEDAAVRPQTLDTSVGLLIREVLDVHTISGRAARYEIVCPPDLLGHFDVALIERVLHNLIGNAVRYCGDAGAIRISARAWNPTDPTACELTVFNTGPVISELQREKLFAKYAKGAGGKRGFGLYFCRLACEAHGGTIEYVPAADGSRFVVRLPGSAGT